MVFKASVIFLLLCCLRGTIALSRGLGSGDQVGPISQVICPTLDEPEYGSVVCSPGSDGLLTEGDTCVYQCAEGFIVSGSHSRECQSNGTWTGSDPICKRLTCSPLTAPDNGMVVCNGNEFEDNCTFSCNEGYNLSGSATRTCQSDRSWSGNEATCTQIPTCPFLDHPDNGMVTCSCGPDGLPTDGDICSYQCDEGHILSGNKFRECQADGTWTGSEPTCVPLSCSPLTAPDNGNIDCTGSQFGDTCTFSCDENFELTGSETRTCQSNRTWSGTDAVCSQVSPLCPFLTAPENGMINCSLGPDGIPSEGDICIYRCDDGFGLHSASQFRQCQSDGNWSGSEATCERLSCQPLSAPENGDIDCIGNVFEDTCTFSCNDNYELTGSETRTCLSNRTWSGTEAMCTLVLVICPDLPAPDNGMIECSNGSDGLPTEGDICVYTCDSGFSLSSDSVTTCQSDGNWSHSEPTCNRLSCSQLSAPVNGTIDCTGSVFEDNCTFSCDSGFNLTGSEVRTCQSDRTWSGTQPVCSLVPPLCPLLDEPENAMVGCTFEIEGISSEGDTCIYICDDGYTIQGEAVRECQSDGSWSGTEPTCVEVPCIPLDAPSNGIANCTGNLYEDVCTFGCNRGYELAGSETRVCMYNGEWSGTMAMCEQVFLCMPLDDPDNGTVQCNDGDDGLPTEGDTCIYYCDEGFTINSGKVRTCLSDGTWSGSEPICEPVLCLPLPAPENGMVSCTARRSNTFGSVCTFSCNQGYELTGNETRTCQSDGNWSGTEAVCTLTLATCPVLTHPDNGIVDCSTIDDENPTEGDTCIYICDEGFMPSGEITRECQSDGTWSGSNITCDRVPCPPLSAPDNGDIDCTGSMFEDTCTFSCDDGFVITGSETRICQSNRNWNGTETRCIAEILLDRCPPLETSELRVLDCALGGDGIPNPGDTCIVACKNGFNSRSSPLRTCQRDRFWSGEEIACKECQVASVDVNVRARRRRTLVTFSAMPSHPEVEYQCRIGQRGRFRPCKSPMVYNNLAAGSYTVTVRASCPDQQHRSRKSVQFTIGGARGQN